MPKREMGHSTVFKSGLNRYVRINHEGTDSIIRSISIRENAIVRTITSGIDEKFLVAR